MPLVLANNFVLPAGSDFNADSPVILYDNQILIDNISYSGTSVLAYPPSNLANPATDLPWKSAGTISQYLQMDPDSPVAVNAIGIARHNFNSGGVQFRVEVNYGLGGGFELVTSYVVPNSDEPILILLNDAIYESVRIRFDPDATAPQIGALFIGRAIFLQRRIYVGHTPITMGRNFNNIVGRSIGGEYLGEVSTGNTRSSQVSLENLTPAWYRTYLDPLLARRGAFFFAWRPGDYPDEVGYCWITGNPRPQNQRPNGMMSVEFDVEGVS